MILIFIVVYDMISDEGPFLFVSRPFSSGRFVSARSSRSLPSALSDHFVDGDKRRGCAVVE